MKLALTATAFAVALTAQGAAQVPSFEISVESATSGRSLVAVIVRAKNNTSFVQNGVAVQCRGRSEDGKVSDLSEFTLPSVQIGETIYRQTYLSIGATTIECAEL